MAAPQTKRHATLVSDFAAAAQGASAKPLDFTTGSVFLALGEAVAGLGTWLQKLYLFALSVTRLASSRGVWVDTFVEPFGMVRFGAIPAVGSCTFSRVTATAQAVVPVGGQVATNDGSQSFVVVADATNGAYDGTQNGGQGGYVLLAGANAIQVPVRAMVAGTTGNVGAGTISRLQSPMPGVDFVINTVAFTTGQNPELDPAVKARFPLFIASLARATRSALAYAVAAIGQGLQLRFLEFTRADGTADPTMNTIFVDDGSGAPSSATVAAAASAINDYRAFGVRIGVVAATGLPANVQMIVQVDPAYVQQTVVANVTAALTVYINGLGFGAPLRFTRLADIAYDASAAVLNVSAVTLNGATGDIVPVLGQTIKAGAIIVNPSA